MIEKSGAVVSAELGGRLLLKYLVKRKLGIYRSGTDEASYFTPTALSSDEMFYLAPPGLEHERAYILLLDPARLPSGYPVLGPRFVDFGGGIEYLLPRGFPQGALANIGTGPRSAWEIELR